MMKASSVGGMGLWRASWLATMSATACLSGAPIVDHPLYPESEGQLTPDRVARLVGYVHAVDGRDVSNLDGGYLLLPGCHIVVTPNEWGRGDMNSGAVTVRTGPVPFAIPMRAGYQYSVEVDPGVMTGPTGRATLKATETDAAGNFVSQFEPARSEAELAECAAKGSS